MGGMEPYIRFRWSGSRPSPPLWPCKEGPGQVSGFKETIYRACDLRERQGVRLTGRSWAGRAGSWPGPR